jgi:hypothetical protein
MAVERAEPSGSLSVEQTVPVSEVPAVQGRASPGGEEGKPPRRSPPEETSAEPPEEDRDQPPHRIDSIV